MNSIDFVIRTSVNVSITLELNFKSMSNLFFPIVFCTMVSCLITRQMSDVSVDSLLGPKHKLTEIAQRMVDMCIKGLLEVSCSGWFTACRNIHCQ